MRSMFELTEKCFVIAEAGTCHATPETNNRVGFAMRYVQAAYEAGADACKFQMFDSTRLFCPYPGDGQRRPRWLDSWLHIDDWRQVKELTEACGMMFLASVFQHSTVDMLEELGVEATKVASRAAKNFPYSRATGTLLISTGMEYPKDKDAIYLQCEAKYPSTKQWLGDEIPPLMAVSADLNIDDIDTQPGSLTFYPANAYPGGLTYIEEYKSSGFSDHSGTPWRAIDAISRGCKLIEVHFYIDPLDAGPDLLASLNINELKLVCEARDAFAELRSDE